MSTATRITVAEYDRMISEGRFDGGLNRPRIELIDEKFRDMSPIGSGRYCSRQVLRAPDKIHPLAFPLVTLPVELLFPLRASGSRGRTNLRPPAAFD